MGYLDNSSITVDAILTRRGRELLAQSHRNNPQDVNVRFKITQFALGDDEIDYQLFNESHPNGTQYSSEAIENMPIIEALPNGPNSMNSKLITLGRGSRYIPYISSDYGTTGLGPYTCGTGATQKTIEVTTHNYGGTGTFQEDYIWTVLDARLTSAMVGLPTDIELDPTGAEWLEFSTIAHSHSVRGQKLGLTPTTSTDLFSDTVVEITTTIIAEGVDSGAVISIPVSFKAQNT